MPFVLRRTKDAVLADLPPKIVQDVVVDPSPLQRHLYQEFQNSQVGVGVYVGAGGYGVRGLCARVENVCVGGRVKAEELLRDTAGADCAAAAPGCPLQALAQISGLVGAGGVSGGGAPSPPPHVFQSLLYLRKLCSHPLLVLDPAVPQHMQVGGWVVQCGCGCGWVGKRRMRLCGPASVPCLPSPGWMPPQSLPFRALGPHAHPPTTL